MKKYLLLTTIIWLIPCLVQAQTVLNLTVDKTEAQPGDLLTYAIHCRNEGTKAVYDLKLKHYLPPGVTVQSASLPLSYLGRSELNFDLGEKLQSKDGKIITVQVKITEQPITGTLISKAVLEYKDKQGGTNLVVFDTAETLLKSELTSETKIISPVITLAEDTPWYSVPLAKYRTSLVKTAQAAEIKVGSNSLIVNLLLAGLIATLSVGLLIGFDKVRKLIKIKSVNKGE